MRVVITGASGLIGSALVRNLTGDGHEVVRLVRRDPAAPDERRWDPARRHVDAADLAGADAVVHLAGAGVGDRRWSDAYKRTVRDSRIDGTATVVEALVSLPESDRPRVLVSGSAVGYYGDTGDEAVDESGRRGSGFLAELVEGWEATATPAADAGIRVVHPRTGIVLAGDGGALGTVLPVFKLGLGGRLGSGRQWMSWISLPDQIAALRFLIDRDDLAGPVNLTAPEPVRNRDYTKAVARAVHRPALAAVPPAALRAALGGFADEGVLVSQRVLPGRLDDAGFVWTHPDVDAALAAVVA
jgi:uncharacterized protein (TIGR01777 family)